MAALRRGQGAFTVSPLAPAGFAKLALSLHLVYKPKLLYPFCAVCQDGTFPFFAVFFFVITHSPVLAHWPQPQHPTVPPFGSWSLEQSHPVPPIISASATQPYETMKLSSPGFLTDYQIFLPSASGICNRYKPNSGRSSSAGAGRPYSGSSCGSTMPPSGRGSVR